MSSDSMSKGHRREPPDPAPEYRDWANHRYTPGYFVGGRLPPWVKGWQGGGGPGIGLLAMSVLLLVALIIYARRDNGEVLPGILLVVVAVIFLAAVVFSLRRPDRRNRSTPR